MLDAAEDGATLDVRYDTPGGFLPHLERDLPSILAAVDPFWRSESLDSFNLGLARKTGPRSAELVGLALFLSDQAWTPFALRVRFAAEGEELEWLHVWIGEADHEGQLTRLPYGSKGTHALLQRVLRQRDDLRWVYEAVVGEP